MGKNKLKFGGFLSICLFLVVGKFCWVGATTQITDYQDIFKPFVTADGSVRIAIRQYMQGSTAKLLVLDPYTLKNAVVLTDSVNFSKKIDEQEWEKTPFFKASKKFTAPPYRLTNYGITEAENKTQGMYLTIDMCPSKRSFEQKMFETITEMPQGRLKPVPIAICLTGSWILHHYSELNWILKQVESGKLDVTWVNHSYTHPYDPRKPYDQTFLLTPGLDFKTEVLKTEITMLGRGITPSPFFRFPGLIANQRLITELGKLSLLPLGSNAWLALGQSPKPGSIILVHGNGNEPYGVELLFSFLHEQKDRFLKGEFEFLPLREAITSKTPGQE